jgi:regulatory protein
VREITGLQVQQRNKERANLYLDGAYAFSITMLEAARLQVGQRLSDTEVAQLRERADADKAYDRALRFLTYRPRSEAEVAKYLASKGVAPVAQQEIMGRLRRLNLVDDEAFARFWVESREHSRPSGWLALRSELRLKGVGDAIIERALETVNQDEGAYRAALKHARRYPNLNDREAQQKMGAFLMRRGFPYSVAKATVKRLVEERAAEGNLKEESEETDAAE